jgi:WD40 repeat protein
MRELDSSTGTSFNAFISYSHAADGALGPALKSGVERYGKPWYRPRVRRVFLDNSNLALASDLTAAIVEGLSRSQSFLLLASPAAASSRWVDQEVAWWLANRDRNRLLVLLTDGTLAWNETGALDHARTTSLPPALRAAGLAEPRWVDLREVRRADLALDAPAWQNALADVVAALDGVDKDQLIGEHIRQVKRTRRTVSAAVVTLLVLLASAVIFAVRSEQQSDTAQRQTLVATSRQLAAQAVTVRDTEPDLARQLLVQAYRMAPTPEITGALLESASIPRVIPVAGLSRDVAVRGELIAIASDDGLAVVDQYSGELLARRTEKPYVGTVAFSDDGRWLAAGASNGMVELYDTSRLDDLVPVATVRAPGDGIVTEVSFVPGTTVLVASITNGEFRIWDLAEPAAPRELATRSGNELVSGGATAVSADGDTLAMSGVEGKILLWDIGTPSDPVLRTTLTGHTGDIDALAFSKEGSLLASGSADYTVRLWNVADLERPREYGVLSGASLGVDSLAFSPDDSTLAIGDGNASINLWNVEDPLRPSLATTLRGHTDTIHGLAFSDDSHTLASASADGSDGNENLSTTNSTVRLWNLTSATRSSATASVAGGSFGASPPFSPVGPTLAVGHPAKFYDLSDPTRPTQVSTFKPSPEVPRNLDADLERTDPGSSIVFGQDDRLLASWRPDGEFVLWTVSGDRARRAGSLRGSVAGAQGIAFGSAASVAVTHGPEDQLQLWDVHDPESPRLVRQANTGTDSVDSLAMQPGGDLLVVGGADGSLNVWDTEGGTTLRQVTTVTRHTGNVESVAFHPDGILLASAEDGGDVRVWDLSDATRPVQVAVLRVGRRFSSPEVEFSQDGSVMAASSTEEVVIWRTDMSAIAGRLCADARNLSPAEWRYYLPDLPYDPPCA